MSVHPNVILLCTLTPGGLARKTYRSLVEKYKRRQGYEEEQPDLLIGDTDYHCLVMENSYEEGWQISSKEGDILVFDLVTYGYGEQISWEKLETQKTDLENWAKHVCEEFHCKYGISVTANYW
jgi:hypothetical protein